MPDPIIINISIEKLDIDFEKYASQDVEKPIESKANISIRLPKNKQSDTCLFEYNITVSVKDSDCYFLSAFAKVVFDSKGLPLDSDSKIKDYCLHTGYSEIIRRLNDIFSCMGHDEFKFST